MTETLPPNLSDADREAFLPLLRERRRELREARRVAEELAEQLRLAEAQAAAQEGQLAQVLASRSWRAVAAMRRLRDGFGLAAARAWLRRGGGAEQAERVAAQAADGQPDLPVAAATAPPRDAYEDWISRFDTLTDEDEAVLREQAADPALPGLLLVCPLDAASATEVPELLAALRRQFFARWQLLLAVRADAPDALVQTAATLAAKEPRVRLQRGMQGLPDHGVGPDERLVLLHPGTLPRDHALGVLAAAATDAAVRLVYGDSDRLGPDGRRSDPFFKPAFSPELLHGMDYLGGCVLLGGRTAGLDAILHAILTGADPNDVLRRFAAPLRGAAAVHWPEVLSHDIRRPGTARHGAAVAVELATGPDPLVSVIIPTRDRVELLRPCVESVLAGTADRVDLILVDNGSTDDATLAFLRDLEGSGVARVLRLPEPFNFSRLNNAAAAAARGEVLVFLNNDTVVRDPTWLQRLTAQAMRPDVGAVGTKLLYPDLTVQHGGIVLGINGTVAHADVGRAADDPGAHGLATTTREVSAVTAACLAIRREVFDRIGGFDPDLAVAFNDVRLCLDAASLGYRNIRLAEPLLVHHEARSRGRDDSHAKIAQFRREAHQARSRHRALFLDDPYYSPNLSLDRIGDLAVPPRWIKPWRRAGRRAGRLRVLIAGATHERDRVPAAFIARQAAELLGRGHDVVVAGPRGAREPDYAGCKRIHLTDAKALAVAAITESVDCLVSHAPLFHPATRWLGRACRTVVCDYGDPHPALFADADAHFAAVAELQLCRDLADRVLPAVADGMVMGAPLLGNTEMAADPSRVAACRARVRAARGWEGRIVILAVAPLARGEAGWSGIPAFLALLEAMELHHPALASRCVFVAHGGGDADELEALAAGGLAVVPDHADRTAELFAAADLYVDLSLSPDFGLGMGRALAHGLPVIGADLPAHRHLPICLSDDPATVLAHVATLAANALNGRARQPVLYETRDLVREAAEAIEALAALPVARTR